ncbi:MAG: ABC transporter ATP-binding protein [Bacteroidales bacterium]|nr:ABC transporter ATP-binding protein [Bacteroidales bacterium]
MHLNKGHENKEVYIHVSNLVKKFGNFNAVDRISFSVFKGEIFGLLGPNGAGKTTTIRMLCGLLSKTDGDIKINGSSVRSEKALTNLIGLCPQENIHWDKLTCIEQLQFMGSMYNLKEDNLSDRSNELLQLLGLADKKNVLASKLSGGMKRRLNLALALVHDPSVVVLDEPEAGLDPQSRVLIRNFIKSLAVDKTIILTTHNMDEADRMADRVAIMDHGKILLIDTPENLKKSVGEGDILELRLSRQPTEKEISTIQIPGKSMKIKTDNNILFIRSAGLTDLIPVLTEKISALGIETESITLRGNTLEDVFIQLTGKNLRQ